MVPEYFSSPQYAQIFRASLDIFKGGKVVSFNNLSQSMADLNHGVIPSWFIQATDVDEKHLTLAAHIPELKENITKSHIFNEFRDKAAKVTTVDEAEAVAVNLLDISTALQYDNEPNLKEEGERFITKQEAIRSGEMTWGYSLGSPDLDKHVMLTPGGLYVIGGIKKGGKTQFALSILDHNLRLDPPVPCMMFSIEMSIEQVLKKLVAKRSGIDSHHIHTRFVSDYEMGEIADSVHDIAATPLHVNQSPAVTTVDIQARTRTWLMKQAVPKHSGIVVVDFIQLINNERNKYESEATTLKNIAYSLARMAKQTGTAVVALAQLRNEAEGQEPRIGYLEGSGGIAQAAEAIILLDLIRRREDGDERNNVGTGLDAFNVIIAGQRHGESGQTVEMYADLKTSNFYDKGD